MDSLQSEIDILEASRLEHSKTMNATNKNNETGLGKVANGHGHANGNGNSHGVGSDVSLDFGK